MSMNWDRLLSVKRLGLEDYHSDQSDSRTEFQRDYDRIIFSPSFRRLQNKTQVFPLPQRIYVHNRLTHSLEVSSVGRSLGDIVSRQLPAKDEVPLIHDFGNIVAAACLVHDIGNPPFGHSGEKVISEYFNEGEGLKMLDGFTDHQKADLQNFEGNANAFRLLTQQFEGKRKGGFVLTYSTLASIVKYPYTSLHSKGGKFGFFESELSIFEKIADDLGIPKRADGTYFRHPLVYLVEAADDICYQTMDIEDAYKLGILNAQETTEVYLSYFHPEKDERQLGSIERTLNRVSDPNEQMAYLRTMAIGKLLSECAATFVANETAIMNGTFEGSLIKNIDAHTQQAYKASSQLAYKRIYRAPQVLEVEMAGFKIISTLMETLCHAVIHPEKTYSKHVLSFVSKQFMPETDDTYVKIRGVIDFVSGMTDLFALDFYRKLTGISLPKM